MEPAETRRSCLFLNDCRIRITRDFCKRMCLTIAYANCYHFSKRINELRPPLEWLQRMAVEVSQAYITQLQ